jgi:hypothetical protein
MRYLLALVLLAHGMVHGLWLMPAPSDPIGKPWPFTLSTSPILSPLGVPASALRLLGSVGVYLVIAVFALSALGAAGVPGLVAIWKPVTLFASALSILLTVVFWNIQFPTSLIIDVALIVTILNNWWPATLVK